MKKAINFDIDTKIYQSVTHKHPSNAYYEIKRFLETNGFEHRQGSGYVSIINVTDTDINILINKMSLSFEWLKDCVKQFDVTNVGRQYSMLNNIRNANDNETPEVEKDVSSFDDYDYEL